MQSYLVASKHPDSINFSYLLIKIGALFALPSFNNLNTASFNDFVAAMRFKQSDVSLVLHDQISIRTFLNAQQQVRVTPNLVSTCTDIIPSAIMSQRTDCHKNVNTSTAFNIACQKGHDFGTSFQQHDSFVAPPPTSRKLAGFCRPL